MAFAIIMGFILFIAIVICGIRESIQISRAQKFIKSHEVAMKSYYRRLLN